MLSQSIRRVGPFECAWLGIPGVMVFFVLTCLVLMWSLERKPHTLDFYIRRIFRIYPLVIVALAAVAIFHAPTGGTPENFFVYHKVPLKEWIKEASLIPGSYESLLAVMWSLPYEMAMYVLLPVVFFFVRKNFSLWPLLVLWGFTIMNCRTTPVMDQSFAVAIGYFLPGVMAYVGFSRWKPVLPAWLLLVALPILWAAFWYRPNFHRGWYFCLAIGLGLPLFRQLKSPALLGPSRVIARYSYGIYLLHPLAIAIGFYVLRYQAAWVQWSALVVSVVALPLAAYHLVELPLIRLGSRLAAHAEKRYEQLDGKQYRQVHTVS